MMLNEYQSQGHSLALVKGHSDFKVLGHITNMAAMPIYSKTLKNLLLQNQ